MTIAPGTKGQGHRSPLAKLVVEWAPDDGKMRRGRQTKTPHKSQIHIGLQNKNTTQNCKTDSKRTSLKTEITQWKDANSVLEIVSGGLLQWPSVPIGMQEELKSS